MRAAVWELRAVLIARSQRAASKFHAAQMRSGAGEWPRGWYCPQMKKNSCAPAPRQLILEQAAAEESRGIPRLADGIFVQATASSGRC